MEQKIMTLSGALERCADMMPEKIFMYHQSESYSYHQTAQLVDRFAAFLMSHGVKTGDRICLMLPRSPELVIAFLAVTKIGALPCPVNYLLTSQDIISFIEDVSPNVLILSSKIVSAEVKLGLGKAKDILCVDIDNNSKEWTAWTEAIAHLSSPNWPSVKISDVAYYNFTTGSTGKPKGALATHENIYWNSRSMIELFSLSDRDIHLCMFASFAHPHELFARALYTGASIVLLQEINPRTIIRTINRYSVTCIMGLSVMYEAMLNHCSSMSMKSLRIVESGGMYTRQEVNEKFLAVFGLPIFSVWGSTETNGVAIANSCSEYRTDGSMGKVCPFYDIKLMSDDGEVAPGDIGELFFKGPGISSGYNGFPPLLDDEGWYASGDLATRDEHGFYYFVERKTGMIKMSGLKIYPLQIENVLLTHPEIGEAAVIGVPDSLKGAVPKAFIVMKRGGCLGVEVIREFCKGKLPSYMLPKELEVVASLPKIGSGKINKKAVAELV